MARSRPRFRSSSARCAGFALAALLLTGESFAQDPERQLLLVFQEGTLSIRAKDVSVRAVLQEWSRLGQTEMVIADALGDRQISLEMSEVGESTLLRTLLGTDWGFVATLREQPAPTLSRFSRLAITPQQAAAAAPPETELPPEARYDYTVPSKARVIVDLPEPTTTKRAVDPVPERMFEYFRPAKAAEVPELAPPAPPAAATGAPETKYEYYVPEKARSKKPR